MNTISEERERTLLQPQMIEKAVLSILSIRLLPFFV